MPKFLSASKHLTVLWKYFFKKVYRKLRVCVCVCVPPVDISLENHLLLKERIIRVQKDKY